MGKEIQKNTQTIFEQIRQVDIAGNEFWSARQMAKVMDYAEFRNFLPVIERAKEACANSGQKIENHFVDFHEMVSIGSGANREMEGLKLSRYGCYLPVADSIKKIEKKEAKNLPAPKKKNGE